MNKFYKSKSELFLLFGAIICVILVLIWHDNFSKNYNEITVFNLKGVKFYIPYQYLSETGTRHGFNTKFGPLKDYLILSAQLPGLEPFPHDGDESHQIRISINRARFDKGMPLSEDKLQVAYKNYQKKIDNYNEYLDEISHGIYKFKNEDLKNIRQIEKKIEDTKGYSMPLGAANHNDIGYYIFLIPEKQRFGTMRCSQAPRCSSRLTVNKYADGGYTIPIEYLDDLAEIDRKVGDFIQTLMNSPRS